MSSGCRSAHRNKTHVSHQPDVIGPQGDLQFSQDLSGFLDSSLKLGQNTECG